jgi:hypothetical protein
MTLRDYRILDRFRVLLQSQVPLEMLAAFGSRVRNGNNDSPEVIDSDFDVLVVTSTLTPQIRRLVSDCAFEAGFDDAVIVSPVVFSHEEWEHEPHRSSPLAATIRAEGVFVAV